MPQDFNTTASVRPGEELDTVKLSAYLRHALPEIHGGLAVEQFPSGHSNLTYLVRIGDQEYVLRRPPFGTKVRTAHDMGREFRVLSKLHKVYAPAPRPILYCEDLEVMGAPFYLMTRLRGLVIRKHLPDFMVDRPDLGRDLSIAVIDNLATLHSLDLEAAGLADFGKPRGYVRRQIEGWSKRWADAQTVSIPDMEELGRWLSDRMPAESGAALIHNDYKLDNILLDPDDVTRITGVLDWEMATVGDPWMDLGTALSYWIGASDPVEFQTVRFSPTTQPGFLSRRQMLDRYQERTGWHVMDPVYYYVYGMFKLAVILQQIYYRYVHGLTKDDRFAGLGEVVRALARQGTGAAGEGKM